jgi:thiol-disulfide isomerase/thioredoxin
MRLSFFLPVLLFNMALGPMERTISNHQTIGSNVEIITFSQLQKITQRKSDSLLVLNFWATWCKPCVQEMPYFENASKQYANEKVRLVYICLNSVKEKAEVDSFVKVKNIRNPVFLLNAPNPNDWIDKVDSSWSGAIPATVFYSKGKKVFFKEGGFTQEEINSKIQFYKR